MVFDEFSLRSSSRSPGDVGDGPVGPVRMGGQNPCSVEWSAPDSGNPCALSAFIARTSASNGAVDELARTVSSPHGLAASTGASRRSPAGPAPAQNGADRVAAGANRQLSMGGLRAAPAQAQSR